MDDEFDYVEMYLVRSSSGNITYASTYEWDAVPLLDFKAGDVMEKVYVPFAKESA